MKVHRLWLEILLLGTAVAFGFALVVATFTAVAGAIDNNRTPAATSQNSSEKAFEGMATAPMWPETLYKS